jgi:lipid A 4'-phosphatase
LAGTRIVLGGLTSRLVAAFALTAALFLVWPGIDLWVSRLFYDGEGFVDAGALEMARNLIWSASILTVLAAVALWLAWLALGREASVPGRIWGWVAAVYLVGPGLLVNGVLKNHWGRARPAQVFGGEAEFTPPFVIADECARNCSFVSGEASSAVALAIVTCVLLWPVLGGRGRRRALLLMSGVAAVAGLLRVITGRHFLSDVVFAAYLTLFVAWALWHLMNVAPAQRAITLPALRSDLRVLAGRVSARWRRLVG